MRDGDARQLLAHSRLPKPSGSLLAILEVREMLDLPPKQGVCSVNLVLDKEVPCGLLPPVAPPQGFRGAHGAPREAGAIWNPGYGTDIMCYSFMSYLFCLLYAPVLPRTSCSKITAFPRVRSVALLFWEKGFHGQIGLGRLD